MDQKAFDHVQAFWAQIAKNKAAKKGWDPMAKVTPEQLAEEARVLNRAEAIRLVRKVREFRVIQLVIKSAPGGYGNEITSTVDRVTNDWNEKLIDSIFIPLVQQGMEKYLETLEAMAKNGTAS